MIEGKYPVVELFSSIQGEGMAMGMPSTFIRLAMCNLHCEWCDTNFTQWNWMSVGEIVDTILKNHFAKRVVLTGGEPTLHALAPLLVELKKHGCYLAIETNGTRAAKSAWPLLDWVSCSPKPESAYMIEHGVRPDELKYVVDDNFEFGVIPEQYVGRIPIWLQPEGSHMHESAQKAYEIVQKHPQLRLGIQMHKIFALR